MDEILKPDSEQLKSHQTEEDVQQDGKAHPRIPTDLKIIGGLVGGTAAATAAAFGGANLYNKHIDRPVKEAVQVSQNQSEEARVAGFNEGGVKFEMTPEGNVRITLPGKLLKELSDRDRRQLDATVENPDGTSQTVDVENPEYHGLGHYSADISTEDKGPSGEIVSEQQNPDNWANMTASPQPGGAPATLEIGIDGSKGPHSEYTIVEPSQTPPAPAN